MGPPAPPEGPSLNRMPHRRSRGKGTEPSWSFPLGLVETDGEYRYLVEVPGFAREDLDVTLENGVLTVSGVRHPAVEEEEGDEHHRLRHTERPYGRFVRTFQLPANAVVDEMDAVCRNGLLTITVAKSAEARPRRIEIGSQGGTRQITSSAA